LHVAHPAENAEQTSQLLFVWNSFAAHAGERIDSHSPPGTRTYPV